MNVYLFSFFFRKSVNTSVNPCEDFYMYTCGDFSYDSAFTIAAEENYKAKLSQINNKGYIDSSVRKAFLSLVYV